MTDENILDGRVGYVDILRGFALMALFIVHMIESYELYWADPQPGPVSDTVYLLFMGKSFSLLALCFGFSFYILMERAAQKGHDFSGRFAWRLLVLLGIGTLHAFVYRGDIIQVLALIGFLLILFHRIRSNRLLVAIAILCFLQPPMLAWILGAAAGADWAQAPMLRYDDPAMQVYLHGNLAETLRANAWIGQVPKWGFMIDSGRIVQILGLFLIGMVLGRIGLFARLGDFARARAVALAIAASMAVLLYFIRPALSTAFAGLELGQAANRSFGWLIGSWFELAGTFTWALLLAAIYQSGARGLIQPFAAAGKLTLTLYILQSVVFVPVFYGFGLGAWDDWSQATRLLVGLGAVALQLWLAAAWLRRFQYGPIEWLWRAATYLTRDIPFRRRPVFPRKGEVAGAA